MITIEDYIINNPESRHRLAALLNEVGEPVQPDDVEGVLNALAKATTIHGRDFANYMIAATHPDTDTIVEAVQYVSAGSDFERMVNKGIYAFARTNPYIKYPVIALSIYFVLRGIFSRG